MCCVCQAGRKPEDFLEEVLTGDPHSRVCKEEGGGGGQERVFEVLSLALGQTSERTMGQKTRENARGGGLQLVFFFT